ncbi:hypothetical protein LINPERPRIM_LOCUS35193, partial [Linum perenne]
MPLLHPRSVVNLNDLDARNARLLESYYEATIEIAQRNLEVVRSYKESQIVLEDEEYAVDGGGDTDLFETQLPSFDLGVNEDFGSATIPDESANDMGTDDLQMQEEEELSFQETLGGNLKRKGLAAPNLYKRPQRN